MYKEILVTSVATAALVYSFPQHLLPERISRQVLRFLIIDTTLFFVWRVFIYTFFFNPLRNLPGPTVSSLDTTPAHPPLTCHRATISCSAMPLRNSPNLQAKQYAGGPPRSQTMDYYDSAPYSMRTGSFARLPRR
jgi:hypothetical protein